MGGSRCHSKEIIIGKSSPNSPILVLIFWGSVHVGDGFPKKVWIGVGERGETYPVFFFFFKSPLRDE